MPSIEIELRLATGETIHGVASQEDVLRGQMGLEGELIYRRELSDQERALTIAQTALAIRMEQGTGFFMLTDHEGRSWLVRAEAIIAAAVRDPDDPTATRKLPLGYRPPSANSM